MNAYSSVHKVTSITVAPAEDLGEGCITRKITAHTEDGRLEFIMFGVSMEALAIESPADADLLEALQALLIRAEREAADPEDVPEIARARAAIAKAAQS